MRRPLRWPGRSHPRTSIVSVAAAIAIVGALIASAVIQAHTLSNVRATDHELTSERRVERFGELVSNDPTMMVEASLLPLREYLFAPRDPVWWGTLADQDIELPPSLLLAAPGTAPTAVAQADRVRPRQQPKPQRRPDRVSPPASQKPPPPSFIGKSSWRTAPSASWYGPGLYGNRTACGQRYTRKIVGVAHRTLPCGTLVQIRWQGITVVVPVIDRGPFGHASNVFDLSAQLACKVMRPKGQRNGCFTRHGLHWRIVVRARPQ